MAEFKGAAGPLPWHWKRLNLHSVIVAANDARVAEVRYWRKHPHGPCSEDDAKFIVRAVNSHDELLAALQAALNDVPLPTGIGIGAGGLEARYPAWVEQARAALAKATKS